MSRHCGADKIRLTLTAQPGRRRNGVQKHILNFKHDLNFAHRISMGQSG
jgi:hypothetical protein